MQAFKCHRADLVIGQVPANTVVANINALKNMLDQVVVRSQHVAVNAWRLERSKETFGKRIDAPNKERCGACFESVYCGRRPFYMTRLKCQTWIPIGSRTDERRGIQ